jgi:opacity protein-like surface antigen
MGIFVVGPLGLRGVKSTILAGATLAAMLSSSSAFAQNCTSTPSLITNIGLLAVPAGAAGAAISGAIGNVNSVFLTQQGSAFVSAPSNPMPDQPGGGVWSRAVGGEADIKSTSVSSGAAAGPGVSGAPVSTTCANAQHESFSGLQVGADIARLNWSGWNVHLGTTAGYLGSKETDNNGFSNTFQVPFLGTYVVATKGRFFADLMVREEYYNINLNNPGFNFFGQPVGAHGYSVSTSAGYNFDLGKNWFVEPSAGFVHSRTSVDNFVSPGATVLGAQGVINTNDVESDLGRLTVRVGRTVETPNVIWQPFFTASVFHEFAGNVVTNFATLPGVFFAPGTGGQVNASFNQQTATSRIGTYGQYSLGLAAQVANTGWLGFVRVDYRDGDNISGWTGNAGLRYQFTPETIASVMPVKAPVKAPRAFIGPTNWTGFYVGGYLGGADGRSTLGFVGDPVDGNKPWVLGALGGIEGGYNYQFSNNWVIGVEGDIGAANIHGGGTAGGPADGVNPATGASTGAFTPAFFTAQDKTNWMGTVTGRVGYSLGRTLFYGQGGVAFEDSSTTVSCIFGPTAGIQLLNAGVPLPGQFRTCNNQAGAVTAGFSTPNYTRVGWTLGFGTEFDLGHNWSAKTEYDFLSFGSHTALATDGTTSLTDKSYVSQVKIGVNYKFTPGVVVAKY